MQRLIEALPEVAFIGVLLCLVGIAIAVPIRQRRRDRRRILADGKAAEALVTQVIPDSRSGRCRVLFSFQPDVAGTQVHCTQKSTLAAVNSLGIREGSQVRVHFLPKWPRYAFIDTLIIAERLAGREAPAAGSNAPQPLAPAVYFISYTDPRRATTAAANAFRWSGGGDITIGDGVVRFSAQRGRPFWFPKLVHEQFALGAVADVEVFEDAVRCEILTQGKARALQFWAVSAEQAKAIGAGLPQQKSASFAPQLAERAAFNARLLEVTPRAPVTPVLIGINVILFVVAAVLGGGIFVPNGDVLIRLGSDYTPLTASGEWWRLLTSCFLHFGLLHLAFNMWALQVNGLVAERLYGSSRYLLLYLAAGVAGSVTSFLWHPFVNGAGASGAIFGVLGALFAYFLRTDSGVPKSVLRAQRKAAGLFIVVSILNGSRIRGIDNAAHLGGLAAGFLLGCLLCRPLDAKRDEQDWNGQWATALALVMGAVFLVGYYVRSGQWHPRVVYDPSGRRVSLAELSPLPHTFGGVTLGMTSAELMRAKGKPVREEPSHWLYDSIDSKHDGLLEVYFQERAEGKPAAVWAVLFWGKREAEPAGISDLLAFTRQDLVMRYGSPVSENKLGPGSGYLYFRNGLLVYTDDDKVTRYGMYTRVQ